MSIKISKLFESVNLKEVKERYRKVKSNTVKFNKGLLTYKSTSTGYCTNFYRNGNLVRNISVQNNNGIYSVEVMNF